MPVTVELTVSEAIRTKSGKSEAGNAFIPDDDAFQLWADSACLSDEDVVVSLQIVSRDEMQELNRKFRGQNKVTNVLSFPVKLPEEIDIKLLGDLALCADVINAEAEEQAKSRDAHWAHMVVHGMLHLQGHDHVDEEDAEKMEATEINILSKLGFENPYTENHE
jgi:probable rRNA maturation factor